MKEIKLIFTEVEWKNIKDFQKKRHLIEIEGIVLRAMEEKDKREKNFNEEENA